MYIILNLTRVLAYIRYELVLSKEQGAKWALNHIDIKYHDIIKRSLRCYQSIKQMIVEKGQAEEYCDYMLN